MTDVATTRDLSDPFISAAAKTEKPEMYFRRGGGRFFPVPSISLLSFLFPAFLFPSLFRLEVTPSNSAKVLGRALLAPANEEERHYSHQTRSLGSKYTKKCGARPQNAFSTSQAIALLPKCVYRTCLTLCAINHGLYCYSYDDNIVI